MWIPEVATRGWIIITRDRRIQERPAEKASVVNHGAKMFVIASREHLRVWDQLEIVVSQWRKVEALSREDGPFIYVMSRTTMTRVDLTE